MHVFLVAWNLQKDRQSAVVKELLKLQEVYPHLGANTLWEWQSACGTVMAASLHTLNSLLGPRQYVSESDRQVVFYSGLPVNPSNDFPAHKAESLATHWDQLDETLEGLYSVARISDDPPQLEVQTDVLGFEKVFYFCQENMCLISNSVRLIECIIGPRALDPLGVSMFVSMGWVGSDHTLRTDIKVMPGGQRWIWRVGQSKPVRTTYYPVSKLALQKRRKLDSSFIEQLANDLMRPLNSLGHNFDSIKCALTGGRDSRFIAALLFGAGISAEYYTYGDLSGGDVAIAKQISKMLTVPYEVYETYEFNVLAEWDTAVRQIVQRADGMYPLQLIAGTVAFSARPLDQLNIRLWGVGGEIARGYYQKPELFLRGAGLEIVQGYLFSQLIKNYNGLILEEGISLVRGYMRYFVEQCLIAGFSPVDIPDALYAFERVGRRGGNNMHASIPFHDSFSPFCTRYFLEAAFAVTALQRCTESIHYEVTRFLSPELHRLPFVGKGWRSQQGAAHVLRTYGNLQWRRIRRKLARLKGMDKQDAKSSAALITDTMFNRLGWLEAKREAIREVCLSQEDSVVWRIVDRSKFERVTSPDTSTEERSRYLKAIFHIATLFYYEIYDQ